MCSQNDFTWPCQNVDDPWCKLPAAHHCWQASWTQCCLKQCHQTLRSHVRQWKWHQQSASDLPRVQPKGRHPVALPVQQSRSCCRWCSCIAWNSYKSSVMPTNCTINYIYCTAVANEHLLATPDHWCTLALWSMHVTLSMIDAKSFLEGSVLPSPVATAIDDIDEHPWSTSLP